jgi:acyl transferase domain-containing protein
MAVALGVSSSPPPKRVSAEETEVNRWDEEQEEQDEEEDGEDEEDEAEDEDEEEDEKRPQKPKAKRPAAKKAHPRPVAPPPGPLTEEYPVVLPLSACSQSTIRVLLAFFRDYLAAPQPPFDDLRYHLLSSALFFCCIHDLEQCAVVGHNVGDLLDTIGAALDTKLPKLGHAAGAMGKGIALNPANNLCFVFAGQGTAYPRMCSELMATSPVFAHTTPRLHRLVPAMNPTGDILKEISVAFGSERAD